MTKSAMVIFHWEPDFRCGSDTLIASVSPENQMPFIVKMSGIHRTNKRQDEALMHAVNREVEHHLKGLESHLHKLDSITYSMPVVRV